MKIKYLFILSLGLLVGTFLYFLIEKIIEEKTILKDKKNQVLVSTITSLTFLSIFTKYGISYIGIKYSFLICLLIVIGYIDFKTKYVYFKTTLLGIFIAIIFIIIEAFSGINVKEYILTGIIGGGIIALTNIITNGGIGGGDAEILIILGLFLGVKMTILIFSIAILGSVAMMTLLLIFKKININNSVPFIPFIAISAIILISNINQEVFNKL